MHNTIQPSDVRRPYHSRRANTLQQAATKFYIILAAGLLLATCLYLQQPQARPLLTSRDLTVLAKDEDSCRLVHKAADQCTFIKKHCPLDEAGFAAYLDLYFCQLPHVKPLAFLVLASWLGLLFSTIGIAASDFFCVDLSTMAKILGMSESMAGVTLLAFGNGSPDVFSTFAAMSTNTGDLAVGELMGAAGFITAVVAGSMAIIRPFKVSKKSFVRDVSFFAVAALFTMLILADGILHLWECLAMIGYYIFYVGFVVIWHWYAARRKRRLDTEATARGHYTPVVDGENDQQPYTDDPDAASVGRPALLRAPSTDDFAALERSVTDDDGDYSDEERDRWLSELSTNMRLSRPVTRPRSKTIAPVRPSLVGALEFSAVLKSLQKSRNLQSVPLNNRRYSDDPNLRAFNVHEEHANHRRASINPSSPSLERPQLHVSVPHATRPGNLAYSAISASQQPQNWRAQGHDVQPEQRTTSSTQHVRFQAPIIEITHHSSPPQSATLAQSTSHLILDSSTSRMPPRAARSEDVLPHRKLLRGLNSPKLSPRGSPRLSPHVLLPSPPRSRSATRNIHTPSSPFPAYRDGPHDPVPPMDSLALPPPVVDSIEEQANTSVNDQIPDSPQSKEWRWWPYKILPSPEALAHILFPTITDWEGKSLWAKALGVVAAPSVFLLTITLPVVESDGASEDVQAAMITTTPRDEWPKSASPTLRMPHFDTPAPLHKTDGLATAGMLNGTEQQLLRDDSDDHEHHNPTQANATPRITRIVSHDETMPTMNQSALLEDWPRWLLLIQLYTAPLTIVASIYIQSPEELPWSWLSRPVLVSLLISTVSLIAVLLTTTPSYRPRQYRWILSLAGFAVSIAWISTVASQVVGTLKALAIILNWSNAIMGLTIFAVGNSVSDLVADVTVANLGYPVMALSACFGGPMLNILLGIGLSGTYTILKGADQRKHKHPDKGFRIKTYHLDVGQTLIVSGVALLVTLLGVLILVPMSKWMMTRKIGIALIVIWILATIGNVVLEVTGIADVKKLI